MLKSRDSPAKDAQAEKPLGKQLLHRRHAKKTDDIPFKILNPKQVLDIAESIARSDSKRFDDVIARIGEIDKSAFEEVLKTRGATLNLIAEK